MFGARSLPHAYPVHATSRAQLAGRVRSTRTHSTGFFLLSRMVSGLFEQLGSAAGRRSVPGSSVGGSIPPRGTTLPVARSRAATPAFAARDKAGAGSRDSLRSSTLIPSTERSAIAVAARSKSVLRNAVAPIMSERSKRRVSRASQVLSKSSKFLSGAARV